MRKAKSVSTKEIDFEDVFITEGGNGIYVRDEGVEYFIPWCAVYFICFRDEDDYPENSNDGGGG